MDIIKYSDYLVEFMGAITFIILVLLAVGLCVGICYTAMNAI